jgi:biotin-dependent carboxylase-like uncharacterized protein
VTGGSSSPKINDENVPMWQYMSVQRGDVLSFGRMKSGCRSYLAVRGGIDVPMVLGSRSTYVRGRFGGLDGRPLKAGDVIEVFASHPFRAGYGMPRELVPQFADNLHVCAILGPQASMFTEEGLTTFFSSQYKVTSEADRMGYRLEGQTVEHKHEADTVSDALLPGAVQIPRSGKPIVVMRDAQATGGYPKIAVVASSDLPVLGQARPNDSIEFSKVTLKEAQEKLRQHLSLVSNLSGMLIKNQRRKAKPDGNADRYS